MKQDFTHTHGLYIVWQEGQQTEGYSMTFEPQRLPSRPIGTDFWLKLTRKKASSEGPRDGVSEILHSIVTGRGAEAIWGIGL